TPVAGTTRDVIEEVIQIKDLPIRIADTAGILEPKDIVTKKAIKRTQNYIELADLVLLVFDGSQQLKKEDLSLIKKLKKKKKPILAVINKIDLPQKIEKEKIIKQFGLIVEISAKKLKNLNILEDKIVNSVYQGKVVSSEGLLISNLRHYEALKRIYSFLKGAIRSLEERLSIEFVAEDLKQALNLLDEILGKNFSEELLDKIFKEFCIGK
ncbi:MAG: GTP-binding protein, partial [Candidatus Omnitrophica bacterium]|nr:GTP-binding protein [Candidatus Omnitrophota bacterium]